MVWLGSRFFLDFSEIFAVYSSRDWIFLKMTERFFLMSCQSCAMYVSKKHKISFKFHFFDFKIEMQLD